MQSDIVFRVDVAVLCTDTYEAYSTLSFFINRPTSLFPAVVAVDPCLLWIVAILVTLKGKATNDTVEWNKERSD